ncbi:MAG TPA: hypothetical protein P5323_04025 [Candidatus Moranbacteria bacterium]|nr:hypothetical protein [Candidatus Moranbacteria bacterium]HRY28278.1 hypothetical protein [Candidatus Moranbacteria bacterium]HSA08051.1 hypothetical protein [Candidatus Moranbacteria bacterium]
MKFEQPSTPSPEEMAKIEKEKALSDAELLKGGADYKFDEKGQKRLDVTDEQIEKARGEMEQDKNKENIESPKIKFPENINIVKALQGKLAEYKERLGAQMKEDPYKAPELFTDTNYKIAVLEKLLTDGEVNTHELSRELNEKYGGFSVGDFDNACAVIEDYTKTGGKEVAGGTGLKFEKKQEEQKKEGNEDTIEKLTPENIENSVKSGKPIEVKVQRSSGEIEKGWMVTGSDGKDAVVIKSVEGGKFIRKVIPIEELQELNKEVDQEELKKNISEVKSFDDLIKTVEKGGGIEGSQEFYDAKKLKNVIDKVRKGELGITYITRTGGLRQKVADLLALEKVRKNLESR